MKPIKLVMRPAQDCARCKHARTDVVVDAIVFVCSKSHDPMDATTCGDFHDRSVNPRLMAGTY